MSKHRDDRRERLEFVRQLFGKDAEPPPKKLPGNHVPAEGNNPAPTDNSDAEVRDFTRQLFNNQD